MPMLFIGPAQLDPSAVECCKGKVMDLARVLDDVECTTVTGLSFKDKSEVYGRAVNILPQVNEWTDRDLVAFLARAESAQLGYGGGIDGLFKDFLEEWSGKDGQPLYKLPNNQVALLVHLHDDDVNDDGELATYAVEWMELLGFLEELGIFKAEQVLWYAAPSVPEEPEYW